MDISETKEENNLIFFCAHCDCEINIEISIQDGDNFYCCDDCLNENYIDEEA